MKKVVFFVFLVIPWLFLGHHWLTKSSNPVPVAIASVPDVQANSEIKSALLKSAPSAVFSPFEVSYKMTHGECYPQLTATVKGKAVRLAVILVPPEGEPNSRIIESDSMIVGFAHADFSIYHPQAGKYLLMVKTFVPEKVVYEKEINFLLNNLKTESVVSHLEARGNNKFEFDKMRVVISKDSNLPVIITDTKVNVVGVKGFVQARGGRRNLIARKNAIDIEVISDVLDLAPGNHYTINGKFAVEGCTCKSLEFTGELVVPGGSVNMSTDNAGLNADQSDNVRTTAQKETEVTRPERPSAHLFSQMHNLRQNMTHKLAEE